MASIFAEQSLQQEHHSQQLCPAPDREEELGMLLELVFLICERAFGVRKLPNLR